LLDYFSLPLYLSIILIKIPLKLILSIPYHRLARKCHFAKMEKSNNKIFYILRWNTVISLIVVLGLLKVSHANSHKLLAARPEDKLCTIDISLIVQVVVLFEKKSCSGTTKIIFIFVTKLLTGIFVTSFE
jgi:hypothetical protein